MNVDRELFNLTSVNLVLSGDRDVLRVEGVDATWDDSDDRRCTLSGIQMRAEKGALVAVVGRVGTGKSSLLSCLLGKGIIYQSHGSEN